MSRCRPLLGALFAAFALLALSAAPVAAAAKKAKSPVKRYHYKVGTYKIVPGQNSIGLRSIPVNAKPLVDGYITRVAPNLVYTKSGKIPPVDIIHLHHGVWINTARKDATSGFGFERPFAAGEEKTIFNFPKGYGYWYDKDDTWFMNDMIHNLTTEPDSIDITWDIDFIPASSPAAKKMRALTPVWMDVVNGSAYPVFDAKKGTGIGGKFTFPDQAINPYGGVEPKNVWTIPRDMTLVTVPFGHLHPGGLWDDLTLTRPGAGATAKKSGKVKPTLYGSGDTVRVFRSKAKYWEPAGAVSWDVAMTATPKDWPGINLKKGDSLRISATYDTSRASWYESMGIIIAFAADGQHGVDPFKQKVDVKGVLTHGHLAENDNHGGEKSALPDARKLASASTTVSEVKIHDFLFGQGDLSALGTGNRPAVVKKGTALTFTNVDADPLAQGIYHTITACKAPCNKTTGVAYPLADGPVEFDSGELGWGPKGITPAANRNTWSTPDNLSAGTYTYFCRIHPFMRGSFRVVD